MVMVVVRWWRVMTGSFLRFRLQLEYIVNVIVGMIGEQIGLFFITIFKILIKNFKLIKIKTYKDRH